MEESKHQKFGYQEQIEKKLILIHKKQKAFQGCNELN